MALNIRNEAVNQLAKKLAERKHMNKTDAVKLALENELRRIDEALPLRKRLRPLPPPPYPGGRTRTFWRPFGGRPPRHPLPHWGFLGGLGPLPEGGGGP